MRGFAVAVSAIVLLLCGVPTSADASWLMIVDDQGAEAACPEGLKPASIKGEGITIAVCVPEETTIDETDAPSEPDSTLDTEKKPHTGPYEGTPVTGPQFN